MSKEEWKRPFTNKRYLHPPFAENMFTMWPDMMVICGDIVEITRGYDSAGYRILVGEKQQAPDFKQVEYFTREDGAPIHRIRQNLGDYTIEMEGLCSIERIPTSFVRISLINHTTKEVKDEIAILPRTGKEYYMRGTEVDGYAQYNTNVHNWGYLSGTWHPEELGNTTVLTDGSYSMLVKYTEKQCNLAWQGAQKGLDWYRRHVLKIDFTLAPGEKKDIFCGFGHGMVLDFDYETEKKKALAFWNEELKRIKLYPGGTQYKPMINNLVMHLLQMFCYPVGKSYCLPRQGGIQRVIWPVEAVEFLMALDRIGDFYDYTQKAYETFFFTLQCKEGEDRGGVQNLSGQRWGSITGGSCFGCARHLLYRKDKAVFERFREPLLLAFEWMERQRDKTRDGAYEGVGIFPPMKSCDWPDIGQSWGLTDGTNLLGYRYLAEAFAYFEDPKAEQIQAAYEEYMQCMKTILAKEVAKEDASLDELYLPEKIGEEKLDPPSGAYFADGPGILIRAGVIEAGSDIAVKVENWFRNRNLMKNGLTGRMNSGILSYLSADPWAGHTWYTSFSDLYWFYNWMESGEIEKAKETLFAQFQWGMSKEYYLLERYADNDPYYTPWMPNASASGRLIMMMADYFGCEEA